MIKRLSVYENLLRTGTIRLLGVYRGSRPLVSGEVLLNGKVLGELTSIGEPASLSGSKAKEQFFYFNARVRPGQRSESNNIIVRAGTPDGTVRFDPVPAGLIEHVAVQPQPEFDVAQLATIPRLNSGPVPVPDVPDAPIHSTGKRILLRAQKVGRHSVDWGSLKPTSRVLDVGSGLGNSALFYSEYLDPDAGGRYWGFDVRRNWVDWCEREITSRFRHVRFFHANLHFSLDSNAYEMAPCTYRFPFAERSFDFVVLHSVFTHMLPDDVEHYLREIRRVLKPGGRALITYFLLNDTTRKAIHDDWTAPLELEIDPA